MNRARMMMMGITAALAGEHAHRVFSERSKKRDHFEKRKRRRQMQKLSRKINRSK